MPADAMREAALSLITAIDTDDIAKNGVKNIDAALEALRAALAEPAQPVELPALPDAKYFSNGPFGQTVIPWYSASQVHAYAEACVKAATADWSAAAAAQADKPAIGHIKQAEWQSLSPEAQARLQDVVVRNDRAARIADGEARERMRNVVLGSAQVAPSAPASDWKQIERIARHCAEGLNGHHASAPAAAPAVPPFAHVYEWDTPFGLHRSLSPRPFNGSQPSRSVAVQAVPAWRVIESDPPPPDVDVLLFCPERGIANEARIECGPHRITSAGTEHAWATHWKPLPAFPEQQP